MTTLITRGTGRTGSKLAQLLYEANRPVLITSRSGKAPAPFKGVLFDWYDPTTYANPFATDAKIDRIYLIGPESVKGLDFVKPFLELAVEKGVQRIVYLAGASPEVLEYVKSLGIEYTIIRATWLQENFARNRGIMTDNSISTATCDGKIPFVNCSDVARVAFDALTIEKVENPYVTIVGPELLTHDQVAELLSEVLGRRITHKRRTLEDSQLYNEHAGMEKEFTVKLSKIEGESAMGSEERLFHAEGTIHGKQCLRDYLRANKELWVKN